MVKHATSPSNENDPNGDNSPSDNNERENAPCSLLSQLYACCVVVVSYRWGHLPNAFIGWAKVSSIARGSGAMCLYSLPTDWRYRLSLARSRIHSISDRLRSAYNGCMTDRQTNRQSDSQRLTAERQTFGARRVVSISLLAAILSWNNSPPGMVQRKLVGHYLVY